MLKNCRGEDIQFDLGQLDVWEQASQEVTFELSSKGSRDDAFQAEESQNKRGVRSSELFVPRRPRLVAQTGLDVCLVPEEHEDSQGEGVWVECCECLRFLSPFLRGVLTWKLRFDQACELKFAGSVGGDTMYFLFLLFGFLMLPFLFFSLK